MSGRIMIADGVATNRIVLKVKLSAASYAVDQVHDGNAIIKQMLNCPPDLLILDSNLPDCNTIQLCEKIRALPPLASIPIILITSEFDGTDKLAALHAGADEVLQKPINEPALLARVRNLLRARVIAKELDLRKATADELGFAESASSFARAGQIAFVAADIRDADKWRDQVKTQMRHNMFAFSTAQALVSLRGMERGPDVFVISENPDVPESGLTLMAEIRSRQETRHASIIIVHEENRQNDVINALDMGANDLLLAGCNSDEMAHRIRVQLARKLQADQLRDTVEDGLRLAMLDPLTGLFNRRYAFPHMQRVAEQSAETGRPFAVMILDLDHFKRINDTYGHSSGDAVLVEVSARIKENLRGVDMVSRLGGEEFLVVMPDTDIVEARAAAERLRRITAEQVIELPNGQGAIQVTTSIGVSLGGLVEKPSAKVEDLLDEADSALLNAKTEGRNQVTMVPNAA